MVNKPVGGGRFTSHHLSKAFMGFHNFPDVLPWYSGRPGKHVHHQDVERMAGRRWDRPSSVLLCRHVVLRRGTVYWWVATEKSCFTLPAPGRPTNIFYRSVYELHHFYSIGVYHHLKRNQHFLKWWLTSGELYSFLDTSAKYLRNIELFTVKSKDNIHRTGTTTLRWC